MVRDDDDDAGGGEEEDDDGGDDEEEDGCGDCDGCGCGDDDGRGDGGDTGRDDALPSPLLSACVAVDGALGINSSNLSLCRPVVIDGRLLLAATSSMGTHGTLSGCRDLVLVMQLSACAGALLLCCWPCCCCCCC